MPLPKPVLRRFRQISLQPYRGTGHQPGREAENGHHHDNDDSEDSLVILVGVDHAVIFITAEATMPEATMKE
jgi:hypothetical protein